MVANSIYCLLLIGVLGVSTYGTGLKFSLPEGRIVGGHEAEPHAHPYQVSMQIKVLWMRTHFCGGSILNERWILTAGHCITELPLPWLLPIDVVAGAHRVNGLEGPVQIRRVIEKIVHPDYAGGVGPYDIALVKMDHALRFTKEVMPVRLPAARSIPSGRSTLTGWGVLRSSIIPSIPEKLQTIDLPVLSYKDCFSAIESLRDAGETNPLKEDSNVCTGPLTGGKSACNGDSGGPLVQYDDQSEAPATTTAATSTSAEPTEVAGEEYASEATGSDESSSSRLRAGRRQPKKCLLREELPQDGPVQIGVVSWGMDPCGSEGAPTVYTQVSSFIDFIDEHING